MPIVKMKKAPKAVKKVNKKSKGRHYYMVYDDKKEVFMGSRLTLRKIQNTLVRIPKRKRRNENQ